MVGLLFLATIAFWLLGCILVSVLLARLIRNRKWRGAAGFTIFAVLLASPFIDELVGRPQFEALCKSNGVQTADISKARAKRVNVKYGARQPVHGGWVPILESDVQYFDATSGELLAAHKNYYSPGGWVMRYTWLSMGSNHPMLFSGNGCGFNARDALFRANQISVVN